MNHIKEVPNLYYLCIFPDSSIYILVLLNFKYFASEYIKFSCGSLRKYHSPRFWGYNPLSHFYVFLCKLAINNIVNIEKSLNMKNLESFFLFWKYFSTLRRIVQYLSATVQLIFLYCSKDRPRCTQTWIILLKEDVFVVSICY